MYAHDILRFTFVHFIGGAIIGYTLFKVMEILAGL